MVTTTQDSREAGNRAHEINRQEMTIRKVFRFSFRPSPIKPISFIQHLICRSQELNCARLPSGFLVKKNSSEVPDNTRTPYGAFVHPPGKRVK